MKRIASHYLNRAEHTRTAARWSVFFMDKYALLHRSFLITGLLFSTTFSIAQPRSQASSQTGSQSNESPAETTQQDKPVYGITGKPASQAELLKEAWSEITSTVTESKGIDTRVQGIAALGLLGQFPQALQLLQEAMHSPDLEVRIAAIQSAGETHNPNLTSDIRNLLDDKEPAVAFTAAITLWKMDDQSGEDILQSVVRGDRSANPGFLKGGIHSANRQLHSPTSLAKIGAMQGAMILLPPVGIGMGAYQYLKGNAGESPRVLAVEQLA